jgi:hypothetical protein
MMKEKYNAFLSGMKAKEIHRDAIFIEDGIINFDKWNDKSLKRKILFLNKEAYTDKKKGFDLREFGHNYFAEYASLYPKTNMMWNRLTAITFALNHTTNKTFPSFNEAFANKDWLQAAAVINLKKSGGLSKSDNSDLELYAKSDGEDILSQIVLIEPDIIILGGTEDLSFKYVFNNQESIDGYFFYSWQNTLIISFWHPAWHLISDQMYYYTLIGAYFKALQENKFKFLK